MLFSRGFLVALATSSMLSVGSCACMHNSCLCDYRPYTCTSCIQFTKDDLEFSTNTCKHGILFQEENVDDKILLRYMEVYKAAGYWTGYVINSGKILTNSTVSTQVNVSLLDSGNCTGNDCCVAWQLNPFGPIALDCDTKLPAICTTSVTFAASKLPEDAGSSGSGMGYVASLSVNGAVSDSHNIMFGANVSLSCNHKKGANVQWYINSDKALDKDVKESDDESILILIFTTPGVYRCEVTTNEGNETIATTLCAIDGKPGDIQTLTAIPLSQSELQVIWLPPDPLGTSDPLLLRYNVCYAEKDSISKICKNVTPQLPDNEIKFQLSKLKKGQTYEISAVAISMLTTTMPSFSRHSALASTYGIAPNESVSGLKVQRLKDDEKALKVSWEQAILTLPEGPVSLYLVEYRDAQQSLSNRAYVQPKSSSLELREVANANDYEVRVAILVEVSQNPLEHSRSPWTKWIRVNGTTSEFPGEVKPEEESQTDIDVIVAAVLVPFTVMLILLLLLATVLFGYRRKKESSCSASVGEKKEFFILAESTRADKGSTDI